MMISVIAWDANFRESLHTIDFFAKQDLEQNQYEFLWVDFYESNDRVREKVAEHQNTRLITLGHQSDQNWHLGKCINAGVAQAKGELLVIPDGDIAVEKDFLSKVSSNHREMKKLVTYHKRYDEPQEASCDKSKTSIDYLKAHTKLINPTNYAGCLALRKESFLSIKGYETHDTFAGPGINGMETYIRLRNAGFPIKWEPEIRVYHPWHPSSGSAGHNMLDMLKEAKNVYPWLIPYAGLEQSWIIQRREVTGAFLASGSDCERLLGGMPSLESLKQRFDKKKAGLLSHFFPFLRT